MTRYGYKHGMIKTPEYASWESMRDRCNNPKSHAWRLYGARGIKVCPEWDNFSKFYEDMGKRPKGHSLDRIDNSKGYSKENCRWATQKMQCNNRRGNVVFRGETATQAAERLGLKSNSVRSRLANGWPIEDAFSFTKLTPAHRSTQLDKKKTHE